MGRRMAQVMALVSNLRDHEVRDALSQIAVAVWPTTDINAHDWDTDTIDEVAQILFSYDLAPKQ